jgi:F0F1-type ATP synthase membrane subunit b/b'
MIVVCTGLMFLLYKILESKVFKPLLEHVEQRESLTTGAAFTATQMRQKTAALKARFDESIFKARVEGSARRAAKEKAAAIVGEAENQAAAELSAGRQQIATQISSAKSGAEGAAQDLAKTLASQVYSQLGQATKPQAIFPLRNIDFPTVYSYPTGALQFTVEMRRALRLGI